ncbi:hypothetical protein A3K70_03375 [Candidatus Bathyarchaeota archaeon RBG_16_48_13]|nr:MAG: hypothetical protein A3K70_03375 [Candidatus Bathyarchaeota archaeon RBG_16_48_13]
MSIVLLIIITAILSATQVAYATPASSPFLTVDRTLDISKGGVITVKDIYHLRNNDTDPISEFTIYLEKDLLTRMDLMSASSGNQPLSTNITPDATGNYSLIHVTFSHAVDPGTDYVFNMTYVYSLLVRGISSGTYGAYMYIYPRLPFAAVNCSVTIVMPETTTLTTLDNASYSLDNVSFTPITYSPRWVYNKIIAPLVPLSNTTQAIFFKANVMQMFYVGSIDRSIALDQFGRIFVSDSYNMMYLDYTSTSTIDLNLLEGRTNVNASDSLGNLKVVSVFGNATVNYATVSFRYYLQTYENVSFTVNYQIPANKYLSKVGTSDRYRLNITLYPSLNWTIRDAAVKISLPEGGDYVASAVHPQTIQKTYLQTVVEYLLPIGAAMNNSATILDYDYAILWSAFRPTLWAGLTIAALGGVVLIARRRKNENPVEAEALPLDDLKEFVDLYDEKNALLDELEEAEEEEKRGVLRKEDRKRMKIVEAQLGTLSKKIGELKPEIRSASTQHANALKRMEVAEADMAAAKDSLKKVDAQIRAGQISREAYEKLKRTYQKRIGSAKGVVDSAIITFKEEVEAF